MIPSLLHFLALESCVPKVVAPRNYLIEIQDPISTSCDSSTIYNGWGMSQKGAIRWSLGNQCASGGNDSTKWPVTWTDYRQILVHYYTGIDILNGSGGKVAPDDRWNLLNFNNNQPLSMVGGLNSQIPIQLQNTSTTDWANGEMVLGYRWSETEPWTDIYAIPETIKGDDANITIQIPAPAINGTHTLHLDVRRQNDPISWFSQQSPIPWFDAQIPSITVSGNSTTTPTATSTLTPTPTTICSSTPGNDFFADCVVSYQANGSNNAWKDPAKTLGAPSCQPWNFLSLGGGGGYVIVDMGAGEEIMDGPGDDLKVYEAGAGRGGINAISEKVQNIRFRALTTFHDKCT